MSETTEVLTFIKVDNVHYLGAFRYPWQSRHMLKYTLQRIVVCELSNVLCVIHVKMKYMILSFKEWEKWLLHQQFCLFQGRNKLQWLENKKEKGNFGSIRSFTFPLLKYEFDLDSTEPCEVTTNLKPGGVTAPVKPTMLLPSLIALTALPPCPTASVTVCHKVQSLKLSPEGPTGCLLCTVLKCQAPHFLSLKNLSRSQT